MMYHYKECGLDNVIIEVDATIDDAGEEVIMIPAINRLHKAIAIELITAPGLLSGQEIRFLRTNMDLMQGQLAQLLHRDSQTIARWEKGKVTIDPAHDILIRRMVADRFAFDEVKNKTIEELSRERVPTPRHDPITIKHSVKGSKHQYKVQKAA